MNTPRTHWLLSVVTAAMVFLGSAGAAEPDLGPLFDHALEMAASAPRPEQELRVLLAAAQGAHDAGCPEHCRRLLQRAVQVAEGTTGAHGALLNVGKKSLECGLIDLADQIAAKIQQEPSRLELLLTTAEALAGSGDDAGALERLSSVTAAAGRHGATHRADWLARAAQIMFGLGRNEQAVPLLAQAASAARELEDPQETDRALVPVVVGYARAGRLQEAVELADQMHGTRERTQALLEACLLLRSKGDRTGGNVLWQQTLAAVEQLSAEQRVQALLERSASYAKRFGPGVVEGLLTGAERLAREDGLLFGPTGVYNRIAMLHADVGQFEDAIRLAEQAGDAVALCTYQVKDILAAAEKGQIERAGRLLEEVEPDRVRYAGPRNVPVLAELWRRLHPEATTADTASVRSEYLRGYVRMLLAKEAAEEGDLAAAQELIDIMDPGRTRQQTLQEAALAALRGTAQTHIQQTVAFARKAAEELIQQEDKLAVKREVALRWVREGKTEEAARVLDEIREQTQHWRNAEGQARVLNSAAIVEMALGRQEAACQTAHKAMQKAQQISCAGCRTQAMRELVEELRAAGEPKLVIAGLDGIEYPTDAIKHATRTLEAMSALSREQRLAILRLALRSALRVVGGASRMEGLMQVARSYARQGLEPDSEAVALLAELPEPFVPPKTESRTRPTPTHDRALLVLFTRRGCAMCREVHELLGSVMGETPYVELRTYDLDNDEDAAVINKALCQALGVPERDHLVAPAVFSARQGLVGREITRETLIKLIRDCRGQPSPDELYASKRSSARTALRNRYESLALLPVLWAGLVDGVNPCAFTVIIFFLSYLAYVGKSRTQIAWAGGIFTAAVFATYFGAGLGLAGLVGLGQSWSDAFARALYAITAVLAGVAAALSLCDGLKCLRGRAREMTLALPDGLKSRIRLAISRRARLGLTIGATAALGAVVALFELPCTGQMYLPTILYGLRSLPGRVWGPVGWLLLYNFCFVLPLAAIFVAVLFGLTSEELTAWFRRHMALAKFAMASVFALLAALMVHQLLSPLA